MTLPAISVPKAGEPIKPKHGSPGAISSPLPAPPIMAPEALVGTGMWFPLFGWEVGGPAFNHCSGRDCRWMFTSASLPMGLGQVSPSELLPLAPALAFERTHAFLLPLPWGDLPPPTSRITPPHRSIRLNIPISSLPIV